MYGDMAVVRGNAAQLRAQGDDVRARALGIKARAEDMNWNSAAATAFRAEIGVTADALGRSAAALDSAADALAAHASAVDEVKAVIRQAQQWAAERLDEARSLAGNVVKVVQDVAENAVTGVMTVIASIPDQLNNVTVSVFKLFGQDVEPAAVARAEDIVRAVPDSPADGSRDWLDIETYLKGK
jgi:methyl-accepting chemotaxis protein